LKDWRSQVLRWLFTKYRKKTSSQTKKTRFLDSMRLENLYMRMTTKLIKTLILPKKNIKIHNMWKKLTSKKITYKKTPYKCMLTRKNSERKTLCRRRLNRVLMKKKSRRKNNLCNSRMNTLVKILLITNHKLKRNIMRNLKLNLWKNRKLKRNQNKKKSSKSFLKESPKSSDLF